MPLVSEHVYLGLLKPVEIISTKRKMLMTKIGICIIGTLILHSATVIMTYCNRQRCQAHTDFLMMTPLVLKRQERVLHVTGLLLQYL